MQKFGMTMSKNKDILPDSNPWWKYNFENEVKGLGQTEFMNVCDALYHGHTLKRRMTMSKTKSWGLNTKQCHKPYKFDFEVKGQHPIRIMNVPNTSFHSDRPMCQIWYANVKANRNYRSYMKTWQKPINLILRSKVNIEWGTWKYMSRLLMGIYPYAKYGKPMSNKKKIGMSRTRICTDRRTDIVIPMYSLELCSRGV